MEIINAHAHIYPEKIAAKATDTIGIFYDIKMQMPAGTAERLIEDGSKAGISRYVVHSVAVDGNHVEIINNYIASECEKHNEFYGFGTMHAEYCDKLKELERLSEVS